MENSVLTHLSLASFLWDMGKQCRPDQTQKNDASDQGLHCLLTESSIRISIKIQPNNPKIKKWTGPNDKMRKFCLA